MFYFHKKGESFKKSQYIQEVLDLNSSSNHFVVTLWHNTINGSFQFILDHHHCQYSFLQEDIKSNNDEQIQHKSIVINKPKL